MPHYIIRHPTASRLHTDELYTDEFPELQQLLLGLWESWSFQRWTHSHSSLSTSFLGCSRCGSQSVRPPLPLKAKRLLLCYKTVIWVKYYLKYLVSCLLMTCGIRTVILPLKSKGWLKASVCGFICLHCPKLVKLVLQFLEVKMVSAEFLIHIICFKYYI